jgi:hypothetical protein
VGTGVTIKGLKSKPELNGGQGRITAYVSRSRFTYDLGEVYL